MYATSFTTTIWRLEPVGGWTFDCVVCFDSASDPYRGLEGCIVLGLTFREDSPSSTSDTSSGKLSTDPIKGGEPVGLAGTKCSAIGVNGDPSDSAPCTSPLPSQRSSSSSSSESSKKSESDADS